MVAQERDPPAVGRAVLGEPPVGAAFHRLVKLFTIHCNLFVESGGPRSVAAVVGVKEKDPASCRNLSGIAHSPIYTVSASRPFWSKLFLKNDFGGSRQLARARKKFA